jgi:hypothetical protein
MQEEKLKASGRGRSRKDGSIEVSTPSAMRVYDQIDALDRAIQKLNDAINNMGIEYEDEEDDE